MWEWWQNGRGEKRSLQLGRGRWSSMWMPYVAHNYTREKRNTYVRGLLLKIHGFYIKFHAYYCMLPPQPFYFRCDKKKNIKKGALWFCMYSNLRLLSFNNPEYRLLQACFNVETPLLIFEPLAPACLGVTGWWMINDQYFTYICGYPRCTHQHSC